MGPLFRLFSYLARYRSLVLATWFCLIAGTLLGMATPWMMQQVIDKALELGSLTAVGLYATGLVALGILGGMFGFAERYGIALVVQGAVADIRNDLYDYLLRLSFGYHDRNRTGQLISRMTSDVDHASGFFGFGITRLISMVITIFGASFMLFRMNWELGVMGIMLMPVMAVTAVKGSGSMHPRFYELRQQFGRITAQLQENFAGVRVVKAFSREDYEIAKLRREMQEFLRQSLGVIAIMALFMPTMSLLTNLGMLLILVYGGWTVIGGRMSLGELVASQGYLMMLVGPMRMIGWLVVRGQRAAAGAQRIYEVLDSQSDVIEPPNALPLPRLRGEVKFENISFGYDNGATVLRDISLAVHPGETIALLGPTGSGKTSIVNLIPRFYDVSAGRVTVDGHDVREVTLQSLRKQIGTVFQEAFLFSGTIAENIAYGREDASIEEISRAAQLAQAHDFIMSFPDGYQTRVGERGITLSGGQRQRVTIARALLLNPRILIMDDSTSAVDTETEYLIQQALDEVMKDRTTFVIAHRLSTVKNADRIVVLEEGRIAEEGTHEALLAHDGPYRRVYETQLADQEEVA